MCHFTSVPVRSLPAPSALKCTTSLASWCISGIVSVFQKHNHAQLHTVNVSGTTGQTENGPSGGLLKSNLWVKGRSVLHSGASGEVDVSMSHLSTPHVIGCTRKVSRNHDQSGNNLKFEHSAQRGAQVAPCILNSSVHRQHNLVRTLLLLYSKAEQKSS